MKIKQEMHEERGQNDRKGRFSRFKDMVERNSRVAIAAFAVTFAMSCSDDTTGRDGGPYDGGPTDADVSQDSGADSGPTSLCALYGPGDAHRVTFSLQQEAMPEGTGHLFRFTGISGSGDTRVSTYALYPVSMSTSEAVGFTVGRQFTKNFSGVGLVTFECCEMTANPCTPSTGDLACTSTLASSVGW